MRHLLDIATLDDGDLVAVLERSRKIALGERFVFDGAIALLFYEPSTRTESTFLTAADRIGAQTLRLFPERSSARKGEGPDETIRTLEAMGVGIVVVRSHEPLLPHRLASIGPSIVNAGDGCRAHPTQALADVLALQAAGREIRGLRVTIVGDHLHSRVTRSTTRLLRRLGASVVLAGPPALTPPELGEALGAEVRHSLDPALDGADAVMALRIQTERLESVTVPGGAAYRRDWGITAKRLESRPGLLLMHPGPANPGVDVDRAVLDHPRSLVRAQVRAGVQARVAVLSLIGEGIR